MGVQVGTRIPTSGLIAAYDPASDANFGLFSSNKYGTTTSFLYGTGSSYEARSNPTNEIVLLANPSNYSPYVLRQNGNQTEYQINLTTQLASSTTYVLSGWYAKSSNYDGADTMFHCRAFSTSGNHVALGTGIGTTIKTQVVGGITWSYCYTTITTPSDYSNQFDWYVGYGQPTHTGYRYYCNLKMEEGTYPNQKNIVTDSVHAIPVNGVTYSSANQGILVLDGSNDYIKILQDLRSGTYTIIGAARYATVGGRTFSALNNNWLMGHWSSTTQNHYAEGWVTDSQSGPSDTNWRIYATTGNTSTDTWQMYVNGVQTYSNSNGSAGPYNFSIGASTGASEFSNSNIGCLYIYNRVLSATEIAEAYEALRGRFGL